jgi:type II secretory pathway component PulF
MKPYLQFINIGQSWTRWRASDDKLTLLQQLVFILSNGFVMTHALDLLARESNKSVFALSKWCAQLREGIPFSTILESNPQWFTPLEVSWVRAGERSNRLPEMIRLWLIQMRQQASDRSYLLGVMLYPLLLCILLMVVFSLVMLLLVPRFEQFLRQSFPEAQWPWLTAKLFAFSHLFHAILDIKILLSCCFFGLLAIVVSWRFREVLMVHVPFWGRCYRWNLSGMFCRTIGMFLQSGMSMAEALETLKLCFVQSQILDAIRSIEDDLSQGLSLSVSFRRCCFFESMIPSIIHAAEGSGSFANAFTELGTYYTERAVSGFQSLLKSLEPLLIVLLSIFIGAMVVALFLPLSDVLQHLPL